MKNTKAQQLKNFEAMIVSAKPFKRDDAYAEWYEFPFEVLDKTPGRSNLGRIEWHMEFVPGRAQRRKYISGRRYIETIRVWATQTRDQRYKNKVFEIPVFTESITADSLRRRGSYLHYVWRAQLCNLHRGLAIYSAYPANHHKKLIIPVDSSICLEPYFV